MKPWLTWCLSMTAINLLVVAAFGFTNPVTVYVDSSPWAELQLISTHFTHLNGLHLLSNLAALFILSVLFPQPVRTLFFGYLLCLVLTACYVKLTAISSFLGFSALLYCHPGAYLVTAMTHRQWSEVMVIMVVLISYLCLQEINNHTTNQAWQSMTMAHLIGFFSGTLTAIGHLKYHAANDREPTSPDRHDFAQHYAADAVRPVNQQ